MTSEQWKAFCQVCLEGLKSEPKGFTIHASDLLRDLHIEQPFLEQINNLGIRANPGFNVNFGAWNSRGEPADIIITPLGAISSGSSVDPDQLKRL